jgi:signal transduction histidine kinase
VACRRAAPLRALAFIACALAVHIALFGSVVRCGVIFPVVGLIVFAAAAQRERRDAVAALALGMAIVLASCAADANGFGVIALLGPLTLLAFALGRLAYARSAMVAELERRTVALRRARDARARLEVATDRARLSGELDAVLERRLGELAVLADAGAAARGDPAVAAVALADIERTSRRTLDEMRAIVGVLRNG